MYKQHHYCQNQLGTIPEKYADILKKFITSLEGKVKAQKKSGLDEA